MEKYIAFRDGDTLNSNPVLIISVVVLNAPILKSLTSASVNHFLETPGSPPSCIMKTK